MEQVEIQKGNPPFASLLSNALSIDQRLAREAAGELVENDFGEVVDVSAIEAERDEAVELAKGHEATIGDLRKQLDAARSTGAEAEQRAKAAEAEVEKLKAELAEAKKPAAQPEVAPKASAKAATKPPAEAPKE